MTSSHQAMATSWKEHRGPVTCIQVDSVLRQKTQVRSCFIPRAILPCFCFAVSAIDTRAGNETLTHKQPPNKHDVQGISGKRPVHLRLGGRVVHRLGSQPRGPNPGPLRAERFQGRPVSPGRVAVHHVRLQSQGEWGGGERLMERQRQTGREEGSRQAGRQATSLRYFFFSVLNDTIPLPFRKAILSAVGTGGKGTTALRKGEGGGGRGSSESRSHRSILSMPDRGDMLHACLSPLKASLEARDYVSRESPLFPLLRLSHHGCRGLFYMSGATFVHGVTRYRTTEDLSLSACLRCRFHARLGTAASPVL